MREITTVTTGSFDRDEFLARASAMCRERQEIVLQRFRDFLAEEGPRVKASKVVAVAAQEYLLPGIQFVFDDIREFGAPSGDERPIEELVGALQFAIETGQSRRVPTAEQFGALFRPFNELARAYGLDQCTVDDVHYAPVWMVGREGDSPARQ